MTFGEDESERDPTAEKESERDPTAEMPVPFVGTSGSDAATELFVDSLQDRERIAADRVAEDIRRLAWQETALFITSIVAAIACLCLAIATVVIVIMGSITGGSLSGAMAALSGAGTAGLRWMTSELRRRRDKLQAMEEESTRVMRAVGVARMITDADQRNAALAELAARIADRVGAYPDGQRTDGKS
jgi:hypothetical protein